MEKSPYYVFDAIEKERIRLLMNKSVISTMDFGTGKNRKVTISKIAKRSLKKAGQAQVLFRIIRYLNCRNIVELGTSLGITTMYLASVNKNDSIITFEGCSNRAGIAQELFNKHDLKNISLIEGNIDKTLLETLDKSNKPDFYFIDANHQYQSLKEYFNICLNYSTEKTIIVIDDIYWSDGMQKAWKEIIDYPEVTATIDIFHMGIVFLKKDLQKKNYKLRL
jgi:predicted O-methyltransferase YrrM